MTGEAFARALRSLPELDRRGDWSERILTVAGVAIRVRLSSPRLAQAALRALAHHAVRDGISRQPRLTISVLDHDAPDNPLRLVAREFRGTSDHIERWCYEGDAGRGLLHGGFRALFLLNRANDRAALWLGEDEELPYHLVTSPLLPIQGWYLAAHGRAVVHAAAVGAETGAVLLAGRSGTGKSTAALACLSDGVGFLGDDMCVIEPSTAPGIRAVVHSLFCSAKLDVADTSRFPALGAALAGSAYAGSDKAVYLFDRHLAARVLRRAPLLGVAIPQRESGAAQRRLTSQQGFLAMAPNTAFQLPGMGRAACAGVKEVVSRTPIFALDLGPTIGGITPRVRAFADRLREGGAGGETTA